MNGLEQSLLRVLYCEIVEGITPIQTRKGEPLFVKHLSLVDQGKIDRDYLSIFEDAVKNGLPTQEQHLLELKVQNLWTDEDEKQLIVASDYVESLKKSIDKTLIPSQKSEVKKILETEKEKLFLLKFRKQSLLESTAESYTERQINLRYITTSLFKDEKGQYLFLDINDPDSLEASFLDELVNLHNESHKKISSNLQKVALASFFQNTFSLCGEEGLYGFFGRPFSSLTFYQTELLNYGRYFRSILINSKTPPPPHVAKDPELLIEWHTNSKNVETLLANKEGNVGIVGTQEDASLIAQTSNAPTISVESEAQKSGKTSMGRDEIMRMMGVTEYKKG